MSPDQFVWLLVIGSSIWVFLDALSIGVKKGQVKGLADMSPLGWFIACLLLWILALPLYIANRGKFVQINQVARLDQNALAAGIAQPVNAADYQKCPYCAELIKREAIICRFCGRDLSISGSGIVAAKNVITTPRPTPRATDSIRVCPKCGVPMIIKVANKGEFQGKSFFVCPNYKQCQQAIPLG